MSAEKGGALVRSPPSIYSHQGVGWGGPNPSLSSSHTHRQPIRATVTKLPSGEGNKTNKYEFTTMDRKSQAQELEETCNCDGWSKAKQLGHDLVQLKVHHEAILKGLFDEVDELKRKNSDLTLTLLMGPKSSQFNDATPSITDAQNIANSAKEEGNAAISEKDLNSITMSGKPIGSSHTMANRRSSDSSRRHNDQNRLDPIDDHSANIERLEEETNDAKRQLEEEKLKNEYLWRVVDELKRQVASAKKDNSKNYKNTPARKLDKGQSMQSNQPVKPLYLPAIVDKQGNKEKADQQMSTSFSNAKPSKESSNGLKNSLFRNSCPALPSINSSNDSFSKFEQKDGDKKKHAEIDYHTDKRDGEHKAINVPVRAKRSSKKDRFLSEEKPSLPDSSLYPKYEPVLKKDKFFKPLSQKLEEPILVENVENDYVLKHSSSETFLTENVGDEEHEWSQPADLDASTGDEVTIVECLTLGNTISILDMPNTTSSSHELLSMRPKTKSKGRRSGRNKKRKNGQSKTDIDM